MNKLSEETITITEKEEGFRLDKVLSGRFKDRYSRSYFQSLIKDHFVLLNGVPIKKRVKPKAGDEVEICFVLSKEIDVLPEDIALDIIFEDEDILVVNKPAGMVVHPAPGNWTKTFVNALLFHCKNIERGEDLRPGIVHRLDKDTSGVLIAAKNKRTQMLLVEMFSKREIKKEYLAICLGNQGEGTISEPIGRHPKLRKKMHVLPCGGKEAVTSYKTLAYRDNLSLVQLFPKTGRTHQLRVHMRYINALILGDETYGNLEVNKKFKAGRQLLHAWKIGFIHPITNKKMDFVADIPEDMAKFIAKVGYEDFSSKS